MTPLDRRTLLRGALGLSAAGLLPGWAMAAQGGRSPEALSGDEIKLTVGHTMASIDGRTGHAVAVNGTIPGPLIRLKEGQRVRLAVTNTLDVKGSHAPRPRARPRLRYAGIQQHHRC